MNNNSDWYQTCMHCGCLVNTYNEHAIIRVQGEKFFLHYHCVENVSLTFAEDNIEYVNTWLLEEKKR